MVRYWKMKGCLIVYVTARPDMQQRLVSAWLSQHNFPHGLLFFTPSFSTDPLRQKAQLLKRLVADVGLHIEAAYGSFKDVNVYSHAGVEGGRIYKAGSSTSSSRKRTEACVCLEAGYSQHLRELSEQEVQLRYSGIEESHRAASVGVQCSPKWEPVDVFIITLKTCLIQNPPASAAHGLLLAPEWKVCGPAQAGTEEAGHPPGLDEDSPLASFPLSFPIPTKLLC